MSDWFPKETLGSLLVPINTRLRTEDTAYILGQSDSMALLIADRSGPVDYLGMVKELAPSRRGSERGPVQAPASGRLGRRRAARGDPALDGRAGGRRRGRHRR